MEHFNSIDRLYAMNWYLLIKWVHIVSSTVLFGTGAGIAFFFVRAQRTGDPRIIAAVGRDVVLADLVFTATAVVLQMRMRDLAVEAAAHDLPLPAVYQLCYRRWFVLGWPAFVGVAAIFYLMVAKPVL
jgi:uncharacterized membrane protein